MKNHHREIASSEYVHGLCKRVPERKRASLTEVVFGSWRVGELEREKVIESSRERRE
jgi:hypothetical protein